MVKSEILVAPLRLSALMFSTSEKQHQAQPHGGDSDEHTGCLAWGNNWMNSDKHNVLLDTFSVFSQENI